MPNIPDHSMHISVDRGGTFTDVYASYPSASNKGDEEGGDREELIIKLLSQDPGNYEDAPREGIRRVLEHVLQKTIPRDEKFTTEKIGTIRLSTTVATNALLERRGAKVALLTTNGFKDLLVIGNQARPDIFALNIQKPEVLYKKVVEVDERVTLVGYTSDPRREEREVKFDDKGKVTRGYDGEEGEHVDIVQGLSGEAVRIMRKPDEKQVEEDLKKLYEEGYRSLAVVFIHSYTFPEHERILGEIARKVGFTHISLSSSAMPMIRAVPRGTSSTADAYLTPVLQDYIDGFFSGFDRSLREGVDQLSKGEVGQKGKVTRVEFMRSDGGLTDVKTFSGLHSVLSGPAGGVVGFALTSYDPKRKQAVIGLDMGGTSTDVSRFAGDYEIVFETTTAGISIQSPQLDINTVAAGGGSRLFFRNGLFVSGPESAGSHPGPACYRKGGPLAVTDANLLLGRLLPRYFPKIFGKTEDQPLDVEASKKAFDELAKVIKEQVKSDMSLDEVAWGFIKVANETMSRPIRALTEARGYAAHKHILSAFGGAAGQHACSIAKTLGIKTILIHRFSSVLSAYGMSLSDRVFEKQEPSSDTFDKEDTEAKLRSRMENLVKDVRKQLEDAGFEEKYIVVEEYLNLRYDGTDTSLMTRIPTDGWIERSSFETTYKQEFGFVLKNKSIIVDDIRVRGIGKSFSTLGPSVFEQAEKLDFKPVDGSKAERASVYFEETGRVDTPVFQIQQLNEGDLIEGPALVIDDTQTVVVDPAPVVCKVLKKSLLIEL